jgi:hypothetical protein
MAKRKPPTPEQRAKYSARAREKYLAYKDSPEFKAENRARVNKYRADNLELVRAKDKARSPKKYAESKEYRRAYAKNNRDRVRAYQQAYHAEHKEEIAAKRAAYYRARGKVLARAHARKKKYGLSPEALSQLMENQEGLCAICSRGVADDTTSKDHKASVDHDHVTGAVRGILCQSCNLALGMFKDDIRIVTNAVGYLRSVQSCAQLE